MIDQPSRKYQTAAPIALADRRWPANTITRAPVWLSTDLRDGNQALFEPMNGARKMKLFQELVRIGFKEIEVGFPAASQTDFDFVRRLIDEDLVPEDVTLMVMTQSRSDLIERTVEALRGAPRAIVHLYNATAPIWRRVVFGMNVTQMLAFIEEHVAHLKRLTDARPETRWTLQYSPETFNATELEVSLKACQTALAAWGAGPGREVIINLPTTVENATPNRFADQIEWMHRHLAPREHIVLSVHPHNDRGTGVAAAELALLAGAQRVEGCLFGNGERCGNLDLVTVALNLYTQGVHPGLDFSDINAVARVAEECTGLPIHPRHPYVGDLVFTAFSGSHQDAIKKGFAAQKADEPWAVPYLPVDPADVGRSYDSVIRVNSQSGKGGIAYLLETGYGVVLPRRLQIEFSAEVQRHTDTHGGEMRASELWELFGRTYLDPAYPVRYIEHHLYEHDGAQGIRLSVEIDGVAHLLSGEGNGPIDAAVHALRGAGVDLQVRGYEERSMGSSVDGGNARACAFVEVARNGSRAERFGVGIDANIVTASIKALVSAVARSRARDGTVATSRAA